MKFEIATVCSAAVMLVLQGCGSDGDVNATTSAPGSSPAPGSTDISTTATATTTLTPKLCTDSQTCGLDVKICTKKGCETSAKRVAVDSASSKMKQLVSTEGDALTLGYKSGVGGPRVYLIEEDGSNQNSMFALPGNEFSFDVELSTMSCGFNAALYFVGMTANEGSAEAGTKYCDGQGVGGTFCSEFDIFEGNTAAQQYTAHGCIDACTSFTDAAECAKADDAKTCDQSGCSINPFRHGPKSTGDAELSNDAWYGSGPGFVLDAAKKFTVVTQFHDSSISRFYIQEGKRIALPSLYVLPPSDGEEFEPLEDPALTSEYCEAVSDSWTAPGEARSTLEQMLKNLESGMVLTMSTWYEQETYDNGLPDGESTGMSWMDGTNVWEAKPTRVGPCNMTTSDDGHHEATFSNIRFGPIGSTTEQELILV